MTFASVNKWHFNLKKETNINVIINVKIVKKKAINKQKY